MRVKEHLKIQRLDRLRAKLKARRGPSFYRVELRKDGRVISDWSPVMEVRHKFGSNFEIITRPDKEGVVSSYSVGLIPVF